MYRARASVLARNFITRGTNKHLEASENYRVAGKMTRDNANANATICAMNKGKLHPSLKHDGKVLIMPILNAKVVLFGT